MPPSPQQPGAAPHAAAVSGKKLPPVEARTMERSRFMQGERVKVLLVEDDEDDYILTRTVFSEIKGWQSELEWINNFPAGLEAMSGNRHDVCLVDYRLGAENGIELLREALARGCEAPIILLTGQGEREIDLEAMRAGAADYLVKRQLDAGLLERSIRYAIERQREAARAAAEQTRLAAFGAEVGLALTRRDSLDAILQRCALALVRYLNGALARIWTFEAEERIFRLRASEGPVVGEAEKKFFPTAQGEPDGGGDRRRQTDFDQ